MLQYYQMFYFYRWQMNACMQVYRLELQEKSSDVTSLQFFFIKNMWNGTADGSSSMSSV